MSWDHLFPFTRPTLIFSQLQIRGEFFLLDAFSTVEEGADETSFFMTSDSCVVHFDAPSSEQRANWISHLRHAINDTDDDDDAQHAPVRNILIRLEFLEVFYEMGFSVALILFSG